MNKLSYEEALEKAPFLIVSTVGTSMLPLIKEGVNTVKITKINAKLKRGDVLLFKRDDGSYVLHRLVRVKKDTVRPEAPQRSPELQSLRICSMAQSRTDGRQSAGCSW